MKKRPTALLALALSAAVPFAFSHSSAKREMPKASTTLSTEETAFGRQGDPRKVTRTIAVDMYDSMRFRPADIRVKQGETIRFVISNKGKMLHELVLGNMGELKEHAELMKNHPGMEHNEPHMAHVNPGEKAVIVWQFTKAGEFHYACLMPGHFEAGMVGRIKVRKG
jgi:uncharacterized cupredoxin-like copper-binding protein